MIWARREAILLVSLFRLSVSSFLRLSDYVCCCSSSFIWPFDSIVSLQSMYNHFDSHSLFFVGDLVVLSSAVDL
jgi:hypothetical protein